MAFREMIAASYLPVLIFLATALLFGLGQLLVAAFIRAAKPGAVKAAAYECGVPARGDARGRVSIHYYVIAVLFLIFDVETVLVYPWAVQYGKLGMLALGAMTLFILLVLFGFLYEWRKGALEWVFADEDFGRL